MIGLTMISPIIIEFPECSAAMANRHAESLADSLRKIHESIELERRRDRDNALDFGTSLAIGLGTAAATAIARGIATWLSRNSGVSLQIKKDGAIVATHLTSADATKIVEAICRTGSHE